MNRESLKIISEKYHGQIHISLGIIIWALYGAKLNWLLPFLIGAYLPDLDHILFIFGYGRKTKYATELRNVLFTKGLRAAISYVMKNHKDNTEIVSHNFAAIGVVLVASIVFGVMGNAFWSGFFMCFFFHFMFDVAEDYLFFGKLNPNWYLKFGKHR